MPSRVRQISVGVRRTVELPLQIAANDREGQLYELFPEVVQAIMNPDVSILWRFVREGDDIIAVPYSEDEVIWLDKRPANDKT